MSDDSSIPPPPTTSLKGPLVIGAVVVLALVGAGVYLARGGGKANSDDEVKIAGVEGATNVEGEFGGAAAPKKKTGGSQPLVLNAAPPPPPEATELPDISEKKTSGSGLPEAKAGPRTKAGPSGCGGTCAPPSAAVQAAMRRRAGAARGCYQSGLRQNSTLSGKLTVGVRVSPTGKTCWAKTVSNSLGDGAVTACILQKFRAGGYPASGSKCAEMNVPLNFVSK